MNREAAGPRARLARPPAPHDERRDQIGLHEDPDHDQRRQHEVDPQEGSSHGEASLSGTPDSVHACASTSPARRGISAPRSFAYEPDASTERVEIRDAEPCGRSLERVRPRRRRPYGLPPGWTRAPAITVDGARACRSRPLRRSAPGSSTFRRTSSSTAARAAPYVEEDPPAPVTDVRPRQGRSGAPGHGARPAGTARADVAPLRRPAALETRGRGAGTARTPFTRTRSAARSRWTTSPPRCSSSPRPTSRAAARRRRRRGLARQFAELVARSPVATATAPADRPLDCSLDSSRARALIRTRLRGVREVLG